MVLQSPPKPSKPIASFSDEVATVTEEPLRERGSLKPQEMLEAVKEKFKTIFDPENAEGPAKLFQRPIAIGVIGLHAVLLFVPMGGHKEEKKKPEQKEKPVAITQIATGMAKPKLPSKLPVAKLDAPKNLPKLNTPSMAPKVNMPGAPKKAESAPAAKPPDSQQPPAKDLPAVTPAPPGAPAGSGGNSSGGDSIDPNNPFADFPHMGSQNADGYYETASTLSAASAHFMQKLPGLKYSATPGSSDASRSVIQFSKGGKTAVLTMFQDGGNVVYAVAETEIASLDELRGSMPPIFGELIATLPTPPPQDGAPRETPLEGDFDQPDKFFAQTDQFRSEIGINPRIIVQDPTSLYSEISGPLSQKFEISAKGSYGGGNLWELKKGKKSYYLNLVPQKGKAGTNLIIWTSMPG